jgi:polyisoprenoid-binding protein YceI
VREVAEGLLRVPLRIRNRDRLLLVVTTAVLLLGAPLRAQESVVNLDPAQTHIEITLGSTLHTVHGMFHLRSGQIRFDRASGKASGSLIVDAASGNTDNSGRDKKMHREILDSAKYPEIVFAPVQVKGSVAPQGSSQVEVSGVFRLHGQDHEMTIPLTVQSATDGQLQVSARFSVPYVKWGLKNPSTFFLRASDTVDVEIRATGQLTSEPTRQ